MSYGACKLTLIPGGYPRYVRFLFWAHEISTFLVTDVYIGENGRSEATSHDKPYGRTRAIPDVYVTIENIIIRDSLAT